MLSILKTLALSVVFAFLLTPISTAQEQPGPAASEHAAMAPGMMWQNKSGPVALYRDNLDIAPVKGNPFCATISSDHTQAFADGNRIHTNESATLCRDSEGRTRREAQLKLLGAVQQSTPQKIITIVDPVSGFRYTLDSSAKIARKMPLPAGLPSSGPPQAGGKDVFFYSSTAATGGSGNPPPGPQTVWINKSVSQTNVPAPNTENIGDQTINGIHATGTRITTTIAAKSMGNEQPIQVVSENWYSPELKATVMTKHSDPWAGQLTTQFTSVTPSEPDPSLFAVPSDYQIVDDKDDHFMIKFQPPAPPPMQ